MTIRRRLLWSLLPAFAALLCAGGLSVYLAIQDAVQEATDSMLRSKAAAVAALVRAEGGGVQVEASSRVMRDFEVANPGEAGEDRHEEGEHDDGDVAYFEIWRDPNTVLARSASLHAADLPFTSVAGEREEQGWNLTLPSGQPGRAVGLRFRPRLVDGTEGASASLIVAADRREMDGMLNSVAMILVGVGTTTLLALALVVPMVLRRGLAPLDAAAEQAAGITATSLSARFPAERLPGELVPITARLNDLLARLEGSFERERNFSSDLAHELRTPIAELRSLAEVALKWPESRSADTDRETLAIASQLDGIVSRLLTLLRSERAQLVVERQRVDLDAEIARACQTIAARARARDVQVSPGVAAGMTVQTDAVIVRAILANLLENAVEYTSIGSRVSITAARSGDQCVLTVANPAPDLRPEDMSRLFDHFWRRSAARSDNEHSGLGLSIARAFTESIGGTLTATLENGEVTFTLVLAERRT